MLTEWDNRNRWRDGQVCPDVGQGIMAPWARRPGVVVVVLPKGKEGKLPEPETVGHLDVRLSLAVVPYRKQYDFFSWVPTQYRRRILWGVRNLPPLFPCHQPHERTCVLTAI
ncbi:hypothetical protein TNCV_3638071 [Trichonephila clavipes]|nr:hypothetical protein TNCV_3638071 [Trichonephila clavipes]